MNIKIGSMVQIDVEKSNSSNDHIIRAAQKGWFGIVKQVGETEAKITIPFKQGSFDIRFHDKMEFGDVDVPLDALINIEDKFKNIRRKKDE